ncbi:uptake hydrogenase small subunit precursor [bacterium BMS3Abin05]|nr:uptake hydrogenase small subunit precursor [bacterium BMS3Abin05]GBE27724.1 uptake hydrogenase small subunit precursor [bacterium BMS3Bbin03]HDZ12911.1 [Ni/Fe] hydrogenase small subunit [Bacteroidota bacterium]
MIDNPQSIYEKMREQGYSRRDFLRFCSYIAAAAGINATGLSTVVKALETKPRPPVIWLHYQECTCCSESFIRASHPVVADIILDKISLDYSELLQAAAGVQAEEVLSETIKKYRGQYLMTVEGSIPTNNGGVYCTIAGRTSLDRVKEIAEGAKAIIAWGSCASWGCVQSANPNPTGATPVHKIITNKPIIRVPGCPPIADVMAGVIVYLLAFDRLPELDHFGRPMSFYSKRVHDSCYRRPYYDAGLFVESFDDGSAKKGHCLYKTGCKGPVTYNSCGIIRWNNGVSYCIQSGHPCIGCTEENFWNNEPFYQHLSSFPGFGIETTADTIGATVGGIAVAGIAAHAIATNIRKRKTIGENASHNAHDDNDTKPADKQEGGE